MNIAEFFVNLGIKGADKTVGALGDVKKSLGQTASLSLEAKAGILAAMYALERLFASSGAAGTSLTNFNAILGEGTQTLQQYQYAARQVGVSNQEVEGSFKGLQGIATKVLMGEAGPKGLARVSQLTGGITPEDMNRFQRNPELLLQKLQDYAAKEKNLGLRNDVLKGFGMSDNMIAALSRNAFRPDVLKKAPTYSEHEIGQLHKADIAWSNLGTKIEMAVGHFNAMHGGQLVNDISKITDQVIRLVEALIRLSDKMHLFTAIEKTVGAAAGLTNSAADLTNEITKDKKGLMHGYWEAYKQQTPALLNYLGGMYGLGAAGNAARPSLPAPHGGGGQTQHIEVNQNLHFQHEGKDHHQTGHSVKKAVKDAYRQYPSQKQAS